MSYYCSYFSPVYCMIELIICMHVVCISNETEYYIRLTIKSLLVSFTNRLHLLVHGASIKMKF